MGGVGAILTAMKRSEREKNCTTGLPDVKNGDGKVQMVLGRL